MNDYIQEIITVQKMSHRYGDFPALQEVEFTVYQGEAFGLLGPNGAGKSTLIGILTGVLEPSGGKAFVNGFSLFQQREEIKKVVGLVPQDLALYHTLTGYENLAFFGSLYDLHGDRLKQRIAAVLEVVQLQEWAQKPVRTYSGGMKRRLNLAVGLLHEPKILFLDEPTVGVDPQSRNHIFECIRQLVKAGLTVFYTTHYMEEAQSLCDRVGIIDRGQLVALDTPRNLIQGVQNKVLELGVLDLPLPVLEQARELSSVERAVFEKGVLYVSANDLVRATVAVLSFLQEKGVPVTSVRTMEANLETVFLKYTGKTLRD